MDMAGIGDTGSGRIDGRADGTSVTVPETDVQGSRAVPGTSVSDAVTDVPGELGVPCTSVSGTVTNVPGGPGVPGTSVPDTVTDVSGGLVSGTSISGTATDVPKGQGTPDTSVPETVTDVPPAAVGRWQHRLADRRARCDLCPRGCILRDGQRGFCFVRSNHGGRIVLDTYGRCSGLAVDPVEKKPLNHFLPGSRVLSFGTAGCNSACRFCQNWTIARARDWHAVGVEAPPERIAALAVRHRAASVAFTYNDPIVFAEYAIDTAAACRERGVHPIAVTAGYMSAAARPEFYGAMDAANIDLKGFTEDFYRRVTGTHLQDVLDTIEYAVNEARTPDGRHVWVELTTLLIPGHNDGDAQLHAECAWIREHCGVDVPLHFSAFHPDYRMRGVPPTPLSTLVRARRIAMGEGLRYVYTGNVHHREGDATLCPNPDCRATLIRRDWYRIETNRVALAADGTGRCPDCGTPVAGRFRR